MRYDIEQAVFGLYRRRSPKKSPSTAVIVIISITSIVPIFFPAIFTIWDMALLGGCITVLIYGGVIAFALIRKRIMFKRFFRYENTQDKVHMIQVSDISEIDEIFEESALIYRFDMDFQGLNLIYNWMNDIGIVQGEVINAYVIQPSLLSGRYPFMKDWKPADWICFRIKDLDINDQNRERFNAEAGYMNLSTLRQILGR
jgi:hypothetical protein